MAKYKAECVKLTRQYLRKMSKNAEDAFIIGFEDAENGKPRIPKEVLCKDEKSAAALNFCYSLYELGYHAGLKGGEGKLTS